MGLRPGTGTLHCPLETSEEKYVGTQMHTSLRGVSKYRGTTDFCTLVPARAHHNNRDFAGYAHGIRVRRVQGELLLLLQAVFLTNHTKIGNPFPHYSRSFIFACFRYSPELPNHSTQYNLGVETFTPIWGENLLKTSYFCVGIPIFPHCANLAHASLEHLSFLLNRKRTAQLQITDLKEPESSCPSLCWPVSSLNSFLHTSSLATG